MKPNNNNAPDMTDYYTKAEILQREKDTAENEQSLRHDLRSDLSGTITDIDQDVDKVEKKVEELSKEGWLLKLTQHNMADNIEKLDKTVQEGFIRLETKLDNNMNNFLDILEKKYTTKLETKTLSISIQGMKDIMSRLTWIIITFVIIAVLGLIIKEWIWS